ncbi:MAG: ATP synthase F1 subunit epsilon [Clostridia bacterium]|nr:ATP synthase F1 subunit epsilon [Clostridia bacterium]
MRSFHLEIVTPDGKSFDGQVESLLVRCDEGDVEILASHADFIATLGTGRARLLLDGRERYASVSGGFLSVKGGEVRLVATTFEFAEDIDLDRAVLAKDNAEAALANPKSEIDERVIKAKLARALNRINVAGKI